MSHEVTGRINNPDAWSPAQSHEDFVFLTHTQGI